MSDGETDVGSGSGSGNSGEYEVEVMYQCKYCPELRFTAQQRDEHRLVHAGDRKKKTPRGSSRRKSDRQASPTPSSTATMFHVAPTDPPPDKKRRNATTPKKPLKPGPGGRGPGRPKKKKGRKIVPKHNYDHGQDKNLRSRFGSG